MDAEVLVAGAGPAGAIAALTLARRGRKVLLVDPGGDGRRIGESLPGAARPLLRDLGLLALLEDELHLPCSGTRFAWRNADLEYYDAIRIPHGPGWHLDRRQFDRALLDAARSAGAEVVTARVSSPQQRSGNWKVSLLEGGRHRELMVKALIDASGRRGVLGRSLGASRRRDDDLVAVYAWYNCAAAADSDSRTLVEAVPEGWWYSSKLNGETRVAALHTDAGTAATILRSPREWQRRLLETRHLSQQLSGATLESAPRGTEACGSQTLPALGYRWLAVGDAALSFDPISSQGLFNALYTGWKGAIAVDAGLQSDMSGLEDYARLLDAIRSHYVRNCTLSYREVGRFGREPFWSRRVESPLAELID